MNSLAPAVDDTVEEGDAVLDNGDVIRSMSFCMATEPSYISSSLSIYADKQQMSIYVYVLFETLVDKWLTNTPYTHHH